MTCIKMGSDESHSVNVSLIVRDKVTRRCPQATTFEEKGELKQIQTEVPLLNSLTARPNRLSVGGAGSIALVCYIIYRCGETVAYIILSHNTGRTSVGMPTDN